MATIAFGLQVPEAKLDAARAFLNELVSSHEGPIDERKKGRGYSRVQVFRQTHPIEQFVFVLQSDDIVAAMKPQDGNNPKIAYIDQKLHEIFGIHPDQMQADVAELWLDWHPEKGVATQEHA